MAASRTVRAGRTESCIVADWEDLIVVWIDGVVGSSSSGISERVLSED